MYIYIYIYVYICVCMYVYIYIYIYIYNLFIYLSYLFIIFFRLKHFYSFFQKKYSFTNYRNITKKKFILHFPKGLINYCENAAYYNSPSLSIKERKKKNNTHINNNNNNKNKQTIQNIAKVTHPYPVH